MRALNAQLCRLVVSVAATLRCHPTTQMASSTRRCRAGAPPAGHQLYALYRLGFCEARRLCGGVGFTPLLVGGREGVSVSSTLSGADPSRPLRFMRIVNEAYFFPLPLHLGQVTSPFQWHLGHFSAYTFRPAVSTQPHRVVCTSPFPGPCIEDCPRSYPSSESRGHGIVFALRISGFVIPQKPRHNPGIVSMPWVCVFRTTKGPRHSTGVVACILTSR